MIKPCLEITWQKDADLGGWTAHYELVLPVHAGDIRDGEHKKGYIRIPISKTKTHVTSKFFPIDEKGVLETPFRDFSHARWDATTLGLEAWVVYGAERQRISRDPAAQIAREMIAEIDRDLKSGQTSFNEDGGLYARKGALEEFLKRLEQKKAPLESERGRIVP